MKTLVTGGAGFIGSNLVSRLLEQGREVVITDDFSRGTRQNLRDIGFPDDIPPVDLRDQSQFRGIFREVDTVFHLAARIGSIEYLHGGDFSELEALQSNLLIDANVFRACRENRVSRIVFASSAAVYPVAVQQDNGVVLSEDSFDYDPPDGGYGWAKRMGELQLGWMPEVAAGIARIFNVYGEHSVLERTSHVTVDLFRKAMTGRGGELVVWGGGTQSRDFLHVSDCVDALLKLEEKAARPPVIVNIGSGQTTAIGTLAEKIARLAGTGKKVTCDTTRPVGPVSRTADIERAGALLGWAPAVSLDEGLRRTHEWLQTKLGDD